MKKNVLAVILPILVFLSLCGCKTSSPPSVESGHKTPLPAPVEAGYKSLTATATGTVLLWGWVDDGYSVNYDPSTLTDQERKNFTQIGLKVLSDKFNKSESVEEAAYCAGALALFYHEKKDVKKYLYWTLKGAEKGSSSAMSILSTAYSRGDGVVEDLEESLKWTFLAAASGDEYSKKWIKEQAPKWMAHQELALHLKEGQKKAKTWMEAHKDAFVSPV